MPDQQLATILSSMLEGIPQVQVGTHLHHANFLVGNKVFAFIQGGGVALKLPKAKIQELVETAYATPLVMGKRTMKEWGVIKHAEPEAYRQDETLFKEAIAYVASQA